MEAFCGFCVVVEGCFTAITDNTAWFAKPRHLEVPNRHLGVLKRYLEVPKRPLEVPSEMQLSHTRNSSALDLM